MYTRPKRLCISKTLTCGLLLQNYSCFRKPQLAFESWSKYVVLLLMWMFHLGAKNSYFWTGFSVLYHGVYCCCWTGSPSINNYAWDVIITFVYTKMSCFFCDAELCLLNVMRSQPSVCKNVQVMNPCTCYVIKSNDLAFILAYRSSPVLAKFVLWRQCLKYYVIKWLSALLMLKKLQINCCTKERLI